MQVDVPYSKANDARKWVKDNCPSYITLNVKTTPDWIDNTEMYITFYFSDERDATLFALRWA